MCAEKRKMIVPVGTGSVVATECIEWMQVL